MWVVYKMFVTAKKAGANAVCEQRVWEAMDADTRSQHILIRAGVASEAEAERIARESPGGTAPGTTRLKSRGFGLKARV
jgi:hypothetical protein